MPSTPTRSGSTSGRMRAQLVAPMTSRASQAPKVIGSRRPLLPWLARSNSSTCTPASCSARTAGRKSTSRSWKGTRPPTLPTRFHNQPCTKTTAGPGRAATAGTNQPSRGTPSDAVNATSSKARSASAGVRVRGWRCPTTISLVSATGVGRGMGAIMSHPRRPAPESPGRRAPASGRGDPLAPGGQNIAPNVGARRLSGPGRSTPAGAAPRRRSSSPHRDRSAPPCRPAGRAGGCGSSR